MLSYRPLYSCTIIAIIQIFSCGALFSQIQNDGVIGAPFYGELSDDSYSIRNQVGPNAEFSIPISLSAHAEKSSLVSGESSQLIASLRLDDGSITSLSLEDTNWETTSSVISINDNFVTATEVNKDARVSINLTSQGYTAVFFIRLKVGEPIPSEKKELDGVIKNALSNSTDLEQTGWKKSDWFGNYYDAGNDWIHHADLGWFFTASNREDSIWLWSATNEWLWTGPSIFPQLFRNNDSSWIYFIQEALPKKVFYNYTTKSLEK